MTRLRVVVSQRQLASLELQRVDLLRPAGGLLVQTHQVLLQIRARVIPVALISGLALVPLERVAVPFVPLWQGNRSFEKASPRLLRQRVARLPQTPYGPPSQGGQRLEALRSRYL
jgi:hypothetical protein